MTEREIAGMPPSENEIRGALSESEKAILYRMRWEAVRGLLRQPSRTTGDPEKENTWQ
jgi:hypothetical protein